jgi:ribosomal protein S18 acetylase RimI-like enzyme
VADRCRTSILYPVDIRDLSVGDENEVLAMSHLLDGEATVSATRRFLRDRGHHLLVAYDDGTAVGFATGVEMTHPDKGTEMFLYELGVDERFRSRGIGKALVVAMAELARTTGCYGMWVLTDVDNAAAMHTYRTAGATDPQNQTMLSWTFART